MRRLLSTLTILFVGFQLYGQETIRVDLNERIEDDKINKSLAILPVYLYEGKRVEPFTMFGVKKKEQADIVIQKLPQMKGVHDTGYTYVYFSGANNDVNQGYCLTIIGNYKRYRRTTFFYIDRNNNLDFTDDGPPDSLTSRDHETTLKLKNIVNPQAEHWIRISRIKYGENMKYKKLLQDHFENHSGKKTFTSINYCYREQRLNTIGGVHKSETDSFVIALKDMNNDGIFNESCMDKIYVGSVNEDVNTDEMSLVLPTPTDIFFEWNKRRYQVISIEPTGKYVDLKESADPVLTKQLEVGKKVPEFSFVNIKNQRESIKNYKKKPTYIFFWDKEKITKKDTMYVRMIHEEFADEVQVITLNHGDAPRSVRIIQYYDEVKWPMAFSAYQIGKIFYLEDLPRGYYLAKRLKLVDDDMSPKGMYEQLVANSTIQ